VWPWCPDQSTEDCSWLALVRRKVLHSLSAAAGVTRKTAIPLPVKIVRLLVSDLQSHLEASAESEGSECSAEEEEVREMESLLTSEDGESEEFDKDPELYGDPLLQMDLQVCMYMCIVWLCCHSYLFVLAGTSCEVFGGYLSAAVFLFIYQTPPQTLRTGHTPFCWHSSKLMLIHVHIVVIRKFLRKVEFVEVIGSKCSTTFWALAQTGVVAAADALGAEDMETLG
jgi:hypothetical protein